MPHCHFRANSLNVTGQPLGIRQWGKMTRGFKARQFGLRILCVMLLVLSGFLHRPMTAMAAQSLDPVAIAYVLPDGSVSTLCVTDADDSKSGMHVDRDCEACRISSSTILPLPPFEAGVIVRTASAEPFLAKHAQFHRLIFPPNAPPRGPPPVLDFI